MKKMILTLLTVTSLTTAMQAQVTFGANAGINYTNLTGDDADGSDAKLGFYAGLHANIGLAKNLKLIPALRVSTEGAQADLVDATAKLNMMYINIPVMFNYSLKNRIFFEAGPQVGVLASAKLKIDSDSEDAKDSFESLNYGIALGGGYMITKNFGANVRYNLGLADIDKDTEVKGGLSGFQVGVLYNLGSKKK